MTNDIERQNFWKTEINNHFIGKKNDYCEKECSLKKQFNTIVKHIDKDEIKYITSNFTKTLIP